MGTLRVGDPLDKNTDVGAINSQAAARADQGARRGRRGGGRRDLPAAVPAAGEGLLVPADRLHERRAELPDRAGGDLRPGALGAHVPHARRGGREGEQHAVRPVGRRLDGEGLAHPLRWRSGCAPASIWANTYNRFDPASPFGGYKESGFGREGGLHGLEPLPRSSTMHEPACPSRRPTSSTSAARSRAPSRAARTRSRARTSRSRSRKDLRDAVRAARGALPELGGDDRVQPRPGALPRRRDDGGPARRVRRADAATRPRSTRRDRSLGLVRGLGRQARAGARLLEPRRGAVLQLHRCPEPTGVVGDRRARGAAARRPRLAARAGDRRRQRRRRRSRPRRIRSRRSTLAEVLATSDVPGGVVNILTGRKRELAPVLAGHMDVNALDLAGRGRTTSRSSSASPPRTSSASSAERRGADALARRRVPRAEDRLAPDRRLGSSLAVSVSRFSQAISEGDGISVIPVLEGDVEALAALAEQAGAEGDRRARGRRRTGPRGHRPADPGARRRSGRSRGRRGRRAS